METELESSILTIKTKKRVLRVRQPANVHHRPKEILGLPRKSAVAETENSITPTIHICPPSDTAGNELLAWVLRTFHRNYSSDYVATIVSYYKGIQSNPSENSGIVFCFVRSVQSMRITRERPLYIQWRETLKGFSNTASRKGPEMKRFSSESMQE